MTNQLPLSASNYQVNDAAVLCVQDSREGMQR